MAAAGPWVLFNDFKLNTLKAHFDFTADTLKVALVTSSSNGLAATLVGATYSALTNELSTANGYTATGAAAGSPALSGGGATGTIALTTADVSWTATGSGFTARGAVLYDATTGYLIAYCLLDSTPADVTVAAGNTFVIQISTNGVFSEA